MESFRFGVTILFTILLAELTRSAEISKVLRAAPARALDGVEGPDYQGYDDYLDEDDSGAKDEEAMMSADPTLGDEVDWKKFSKGGKGNKEGKEGKGGKGSNRFDDPEEYDAKDYEDYEETIQKKGLSNDGLADYEDAVPLPPEVMDNEDKWESTHPSQGGVVIRQTGNLDPPAYTCLNIKVIFNSRWVSHFGNEQSARDAAREVVNQAERIYQEEFVPSGRLNTRVSIAIAGGDPVFDSESDATWQATSSSLYSSAVRRHIDSSSNTIHHYAFLTGQDHSGAIGIAWLNSACLRSTSDQSYKTSINEFHNNIADSAGVLAHEIGHALGMSHDFLGGGSNRYDSEGNVCTGIQGVMDYGSRPMVDKWSSCSKEDFKNFYNSMLSQHNGVFCMEQNCAVDPNPPTTPPSAGAPCSNRGQPTEITSSGTVIKTPNHPGNYPNDALCDWIVRFPAGSKVSLNFLAFSLQHSGRCRKDRLRLWDGDYRSRHNRLEWPGFCGMNHPETVVSPNNEMFIRFKSNDREVSTGFEIRIEEVPYCGGTITSNGTILSPEHPQNYPNNEDCEWVIRFPEEERIMLEFVAFNLEYAYRCRWDYLDVRNGPDATSPRIGERRCGSDLPGPIISEGNELYLHFHSDYSVSRSGFEIKVSKTSENPNTPIGCGSRITTPGTEFTSRNHPNNYPNNDQCENLIKFEEGATIRLEFLEFDLEYNGACMYDWLRVYDGGDESAPMIGTALCGSQLPEAITSSGNMLYVKFKSDFSIVSTGYKIRADLATAPPSTAQPPTDATTADPPASPTTNPPTTGCGIVPQDIVGGGEATPYSLPWQVALVSSGGSRPFCGGTLISPNHVLTAAHCTGSSNFDIIVGEHRITDSSDGTRHQVCRVENHPNYNRPSQLNNDFAIVHLRDAVTIGPRANIACLADSSLAGDFLVGKSLTVSGWGRLSSGGSQPGVLHKVDVPAVSNAQCAQAYSQYSITNAMLCAGDIANGGVDSCQGDSGGPLTYNNNGRVTLVGVVSWGIGCAQPNYPGVYARVTEALDFINGQLAQTCTAGHEEVLG